MSWGIRVYDHKGLNRAVFSESSTDFRLLKTVRLEVVNNVATVALDLRPYGGPSNLVKVLPVGHFLSEFNGSLYARGHTSAMDVSYNSTSVVFTRSGYLGLTSKTYFDVLVYKIL